MKSAAVLQTEHIPMPGGFTMHQTHEKPERRWHGIGVLYSREVDGIIEFRVLYESHIPLDVRAAVEELFGIGAIEWKV
jgi:hypothetical protein